MVTFDIQGDVATVQELIHDDLQDGNVVINFDGNTLVANSVLLVDGEEFDPNNEVTKNPNVMHSNKTGNKSCISNFEVMTIGSWHRGKK